ERAGFEPATHLAAGTRFPVALLRPTRTPLRAEFSLEDRDGSLELLVDQEASSLSEWKTDLNERSILVTTLLNALIIGRHLLTAFARCGQRRDRARAAGG